MNDNSTDVLQSQVPNFNFMTAKDRIAQGISPPRPLVGNLLFRKTIAGLTAPEDSHKTNCATQLAICLSLGIPCYSYSCKKSQVAYLVLEGGEDYILERLEEKIEAMGVNRDEALQGIYILDCPSMQLDDEATAQRLKQNLLDLNPRPEVVILDPITYALNEDVRYSPNKTKLVRNSLEIAKVLDGVVLLIVHTRKGAKDNADMDDFLGSGQIARAAATRIKLYRKDNRVNMYVKVRHSERPNPLSLVWKHPLLEVEQEILRPREEAKAAILQALENAPYNIKATVLGELVRQVAQSTEHNEKTVRAAITNLEVEGKVEILRVQDSATKVVKLVE